MSLKQKQKVINTLTSEIKDLKEQFEKELEYERLNGDRIYAQLIMLWQENNYQKEQIRQLKSIIVDRDNEGECAMNMLTNTRAEVKHMRKYIQEAQWMSTQNSNCIGDNVVRTWPSLIHDVQLQLNKALESYKMYQDNDGTDSDSSDNDYA